MRCEVCGSENKVHVVASSLGPISNAVCESCICKGYEPMANVFAFITTAYSSIVELEADTLDYIRKQCEGNEQDFEEFMKECGEEFAKDEQ